MPHPNDITARLRKKHIKEIRCIWCEITGDAPGKDIAKAKKKVKMEMDELESTIFFHRLMHFVQFTMQTHAKICFIHGFGVYPFYYAAMQ